MSGNLYIRSTTQGTSNSFCQFVISQPPPQNNKFILIYDRRGYHILLEKPMATNEQDCRDIVEAIEKNGVIMAIGHVRQSN